MASAAAAEASDAQDERLGKLLSGVVEPEPEPGLSASPGGDGGSIASSSSSSSSSTRPLALPVLKGRGLFTDNVVGLREAICRCTNRSKLRGIEVVMMGLDRPSAPATTPYIAYQMEQLRSPMIDDECREVLRGALAVWETAPGNVAHWESVLAGEHTEADGSIPPRRPRCYFVPLWHTLPRSALLPMDEPVAADERIDVLMFGSMNERREQLGQQLEAAGVRDLRGIPLPRPSHGPRTCPPRALPPRPYPHERTHAHTWVG
jgi:hypothetical protein